MRIGVVTSASLFSVSSWSSSLVYSSLFFSNGTLSKFKFGYVSHGGSSGVVVSLRSLLQTLIRGAVMFRHPGLVFSLAVFLSPILAV